MSSFNLLNETSIPSSQKLKFRGDTLSQPRSTQLKLRKREFEQKQERRNLTLLKHPCSVLVLFVDVVKEYLTSLFKQVLSTPIILIIIIPILFIVCCHWMIPSFYQIELVEYCYIYIEWLLWWLILGILSSIGLGTGMHSGLLFLFPFIGQVCMVAATCHSLKFNTFGRNAFICIEKNDEIHSTVTFWGLFCKVFIACFLWGSGTAIGEIPPYAVSLARVRAGKQDEFTELQQDLTSHGSRFLNRMKLWMINFLEKYGFWAVLAFAAWPNMAFDMCGIACGHFEMSFWTFFGATFIGKAIIKINMQSMFFITMFNEKTLNKFIDYLEHLGFEFLSDAATDFFETQRNIILGNIDSQTVQKKSTPLFKIAWTVIVIGFILMFIASTIQLFAQQKLKEIHEKENDKWLKAQTEN